MKSLVTKKILSNQQFTDEKEIEKSIAERLSFYPGAMVWVIELSGRPVNVKGRTILIPFKGKFYRVGASDIIFFYESMYFAFEVKTKDEYLYIKRNLKKICSMHPDTMNKKQKHIFDQWNFIVDVRKSGGNGAFVYCFDQVELIIKNALLEKKKGLD